MLAEHGARPGGHAQPRRRGRRWCTARTPVWRCSSRCSTTGELRAHHRLHAVRAHLLELAGRPSEARAAYAHAARLATSIPEQRYLNERAAETEA